jgi:hypothetical protein
MSLQAASAMEMQLNLVPLSTEAASSAGALQKDEIDYEDDEDEDEKERLSTGPQAISSATRELSPTNGKRSRADLESDDGASTRSKDAKRPRS